MKCPMKFNNSAAFKCGTPETFDCDPECAWLLAVKERANDPNGPVSEYACALSLFTATGNAYVQNYMRGDAL